MQPELVLLVAGGGCSITDGCHDLPGICSILTFDTGTQTVNIMLPANSPGSVKYRSTLTMNLVELNLVAALWIFCSSPWQAVLQTR